MRISEKTLARSPGKIRSWSPMPTQNSFSFALVSFGLSSNGLNLSRELLSDCAAEHADMAEAVSKMGESDIERLTASHGKSGDRVILPSRLDSVFRLGPGHHLLDDVFLHERGVFCLDRRCGAIRHCMAPGHDHDHRLGLFLGDEVCRE